MNRPGHTRYTLRFGGAAGGGAGAAAEPPGRPPQPPPADDWSGLAAYAAAPDPQALDYAHPEAVALLMGLQPAGWQEQDDGQTLVFWLADGAEREPAAREALSALGRLATLEVERERPGWEDAWRRFHRPQRVGRLWVRPPWYPAKPGLLDVVVEAGMAFGTGGHASTRQCLEELQVISPGSLVDLGSGSGVVSFAALRLGFEPVWGVDIDPVAVHAAAGNAAMNGLTPTFVVGDATDPGYPLPAADTVVANIALRPILRLARRWAPGAEAAGAETDGASAGMDAAQAAPDAGPAAPEAAQPSPVPRHLLLAGLLVEQGEEAAAAYPGFEVTARRRDGMWLMLHLVRP